MICVDPSRLMGHLGEVVAHEVSTVYQFNHPQRKVFLNLYITWLDRIWSMRVKIGLLFSVI